MRKRIFLSLALSVVSLLAVSAQEVSPIAKKANHCGTSGQTHPVDTLVVPTLPQLASDLPQTASLDVPPAATIDSVAVVESPAARAQRLMVAQLTQMLDDPLLTRTQLGLCIYDLTEGRMLFQHGAKQRMRPASTMKVVSAVCGIDVLGGGYNFRTEVRADSVLASDTLRTNLYVRGTMDPLFGREHLQRFVSRLVADSVKAWRGDLVLDISHKDTVAAGWGWCWDDDNPSLFPLLCDGSDALVPTLRDVLRRHNITWQGGVKYGMAPATSVSVFTQKHTLDQVLLPMMKQSDNQMAEAVFYSIAAHTGKRYAGRKAAAGLINNVIGQKLHLQAKDYQIADGSGLSLYNYVTPELLMALLRYAYYDSRIYSHLLPSLPVMGEDGTLKKRCIGTSAHGKVQAKTGTVTGVSALAGYAQTAHGHTLCFAIINQGVETSKTGRDFQDKVCQILTRSYECE